MERGLSNVEGVAILILLELTLQSDKKLFEVVRNNVAILILLELTLQLNLTDEIKNNDSGRNPYFIGINSAIYSYSLQPNDS